MVSFLTKSQDKWLYGIATISILLLAFFIVYDSTIPMITSDGFNFYMELLHSKSLWHGLGIADIKRFFPLAGWNYTFIAQFSTSPYAFMFGNACILCFFSLCYIFLAKQTGISTIWTLAMLGCMVLSVGYAKLLGEIVFPELTQTFFLLLFLCCAYRFYKAKTKWIMWWFGVLAIVFGNCVIYLKEVSFILISFLVLGFCTYCSIIM